MRDHVGDTNELTPPDPMRSDTIMTAHPGRRLAAYAQHKGLGVRDFAKAVGFSPAYVSDLFRGRRSLSWEFAHRVERAFPDQRARFWADLQLCWDERQRRIEFDIEFPRGTTTMNQEKLYTCADCGAAITAAEGRVVCSLCESCWDKAYHNHPAAPVAVKMTDVMIEDTARLADGFVRNCSVAEQGTVALRFAQAVLRLREILAHKVREIEDYHMALTLVKAERDAAEAAASSLGAHRPCPNCGSVMDLLPTGWNCYNPDCRGAT